MPLLVISQLAAVAGEPVNVQAVCVDLDQLLVSLLHSLLIRAHTRPKRKCTLTTQACPRTENQMLHHPLVSFQWTLPNFTPVKN